MTNVNPIPPLLCSTPPPMDFEEEEDDFELASAETLDDDSYNFALTTENMENAPVSLPECGRFEYSDMPPNIESDTHVTCIFPHQNTETESKVVNRSPVEAYNFDVTRTLMTNDVQKVSDLNENVELGCCNDNEKVKKFANLTHEPSSTTCEQYSENESDNSENTLKKNLHEKYNENYINLKTCAKDNMKNPTVNSNSLVALEDIVDDSSDDERHSAYRSKNDVTFENSEDFFAIHMVKSSDNSAIINKMVKKSTPATITDLKTNSTHDKMVDEVNNQSESDDGIFSSFQTANGADITVLEEQQTSKTNPQEDSCNFEADFSQFNNNINEHVDVIQSDSGILAGTKEVSDDDDEFGDFSQASFTSSPISDTKTPIETATTQVFSHSAKEEANIINERLRTVLHMMFPSVCIESNDTENTSNSNVVLPLKTFQLETIDTAKALEYQWINSGMRHALIKSLGIDSNNILLGYKWNSSMPKFAANLSFDPLKPMKPHTQAVLTTATPSAASHTDASIPDDASKIDVPAVDFDWKSSGLVNPFEGSKENANARETETLHETQLDEYPTAGDQQQQQKPHHPHATNACHNNDYDAAAAPSACAHASTATPLPPIDSSVSISNGFNDISNNTELNAQISTANRIEPVGGEGAAEINVNVEHFNDKLNRETTSDNVNHGRTIQLDLITQKDEGVVTKSTYAGPLKETHIYTPSASENSVAKTSRAKTTTEPIDFDYEIAAAGIIIDETVVKKEYRDVEYNPGFGLEFSRTKKAKSIDEQFDVYKPELDSTEMTKPSSVALNEVKVQTFENDDEFSDFQSVPPPTIVGSAISPQKVKQLASNVSRTSTPSLSDEMILSPAILLPHTICSENSRPKIEWGDSAASINPEELARIEELFSKSGSLKAAETSNSQKESSHPPNNTNNMLSISACIAQQEQQNVLHDEDDWSDFISVPLESSVKAPHLNTNNNQQVTSGTLTTNNSPHRIYHHHQQQQQKLNEHINPRVNATFPYTKSNDDEWSDFVSSAPKHETSSYAHAHAKANPQFNSASWQCSNLYNNPLSFYQQTHTNAFSHLTPSLKTQNNNNNNNNNMFSNINIKNTGKPLSKNQMVQQQQATQQIHMMHDFSTSSPKHSNRLDYPAPFESLHSSQFHIGSAKVAPSVSLIPDLGFATPAVRTTFIHSLPKPTFTGKK